MAITKGNLGIRQNANEPKRMNMRAYVLASAANLKVSHVTLLICLLCALAYANSLGGDFVFDDTDQIVQNQNIRSWGNLSKSFTTHVWAFRERTGTLDLPPPLPYYRPLFTVMLTVEYHLFGLWPQGWHLVSLLLHILCSVGVFYVTLLSSGRQTVALFASALFAVHPVHAESVAWISGMTDPLFGVFFLASFYFYLKARSASEYTDTQRRAFAASLAMFLLAAFAKETALSLVLLIFGYEFVATPGPKVKRLIASLKRSLPYIVTALLYLVPRYLVLGESMWRNPQASSRPVSQVLLTLPMVICSYASHLIWPFGLSVTYQTSFVTNVASSRFLIPAAILLVLTITLAKFDKLQFVDVNRRRQTEVCRTVRSHVSREVWLALLLIIVPLLPVLNLGQVSQEEYLVFDHYLYLPAAGLSYLVVLGLTHLASSEFARRRHSFSTAILVATIVLVVGLSIANARENQPWANSLSLWSNAARVRPGYWAPRYNVGLALLDSHRFDEARPVLEAAAVLARDEPRVFDALGRAQAGAGDREAAISSFRRAIELDPSMFESMNNLGTVYFESGEYSRAAEQFSSALQLNAAAVSPRFNLGMCYARQGRNIDAAREFEQLSRHSVADADVFYQLGLAYEHLGRRADARENYRLGLARADSETMRAELNAGIARLQGTGDQ